MTRAYNELYLNDAKMCLGNMFDYAINDANFEPDFYVSMFLISDLSSQFEKGNPSVIAGMSGAELARKVISQVYNAETLPPPCNYQFRTPEFWVGWALAEYQWYTGRSFNDIFGRVSFGTMLDMYSVYHEMDITQFIDAMENIYENFLTETKLKQIRENRGLSQSELSAQAGVHLRSIQMYEQRVNDIDKSQAKSLYKIARVLGCNIEDLLENPLK